MGTPIPRSTSLFINIAMEILYHIFYVLAKFGCGLEGIVYEDLSILDNALIKSSIIPSSCNGAGANRNRSVPTSTVG